MPYDPTQYGQREKRDDDTQDQCWREAYDCRQHIQNIIDLAKRIHAEALRLSEMGCAGLAYRGQIVRAARYDDGETILGDDGYPVMIKETGWRWDTPSEIASVVEDWCFGDPEKSIERDAAERLEQARAGQ